MSTAEKFFAAVDVIESLPSDGTFQPSEDLMLKLCAYYNQATQGPCRISKPSIWNYSSRIQWNAWNDLGNMDREVAMEKYIEELTEVIETMSYNENVSKFMSLIGPFYEVVPSEEADIQSEKSSNKKSPTEYSYPVKKLEDVHTAKNIHSPKTSGNKDYSLCSPGRTRTRNGKQHKSGNLNGSAKYIPKQSVIDMFRAKTNMKHQPFGSHQDILILTIINLQNSLQEIVKKFDNLQSLARSADFRSEAEKEDKTPIQRNLSYSGIALALLWPVAVNLCTRSF